MERLQVSDFDRLWTADPSTCVSIYFTTTPGGPGAQGNRTRLKNALKVAETQLADTDLPAAAAGQLLEPACRLVDDDSFWLRCQHGFALWLSAETQSMYLSSAVFRESVSVGPHFRVRPLVSVMEAAKAACVLTLSQDAVRLFAPAGTNAKSSTCPICQKTCTTRSTSPRSIGAPNSIPSVKAATRNRRPCFTPRAPATTPRSKTSANIVGKSPTR